MPENATVEINTPRPDAPAEQKPLHPVGGEHQQSTETENPYEEMTSYFMLDLLLEGKLPAEAVPLYFQKSMEEEIAVATGALYKRINNDPVSRKFAHIIQAQHDKILAEKYSDPQVIEQRVKAIEAKYNGLLQNPQEQARYFANQANELWQSSNTTRAANLYGLASQLARSRSADAEITAVRTALQTEGKPAA